MARAHALHRASPPLLFPLFVAMSVLVLWPSLASAEERTLDAIKDATIFSENGMSANGGGEFCHIGVTNTGNVRRALVEFNLSIIPPSSTINSVTLELEIDRAQNATTPDNFQVFAVTEAWSEGTSNPPGMEGGGRLAEAGDVTWTHSNFDTVTWTDMGGSVSTPPAGEADFPFAVGAVSVDLGTTALIADWTNGTQSNFGLLIRAEDEALSDARRITSRTGAGLGPRLIVDFTPPMGVEFCDNAADDDADGDVDCADADCAAVSECIAEVCDNGADDDNDGSMDCADDECAADAACLEVCDDAADNDLDGLTDCADPDCDADPLCATPTEVCDNTIDDDGDGATDCDDPDCDADPACIPPASEICDDALDNDGDGATDCDDTDCDADPACDPGADMVIGDTSSGMADTSSGMADTSSGMADTSSGMADTSSSGAGDASSSSGGQDASSSDIGGGDDGEEEGCGCSSLRASDEDGSKGPLSGLLGGFAALGLLGLRRRRAPKR